MTTNQTAFYNALVAAYTVLFATNTDEYNFAANITTPEGLAEKMTLGLTRGSAHHDGTGIKRACKALGIKHTRTAITVFLRDPK